MRRIVSIAPMMDWTDRHCRYFMRQFTPSALLYTEMVTAAAIVHGDADRFLRFNGAEHPVALQLGGSDPDWMARATAAANEYGYDEININVGCPSDRVQSGRFGACLMADPALVAQCLSAMQAESDAPVTVKSRIGIDDHDSYDFLVAFVEPLLEAGCRKFVVHARIAVLEGLSPKENRSVPPLDYERVYRLKQDFPALEIVLNGGIESCADVDAALGRVDGVMIGRRAYHQPYFLAELERHLHPDWQPPARSDIVERMLPYIEEQLGEGAALNAITRHMLGLFAGQPGARAWRRYVSEHAHRPGAGSEVLVNALNAMPAAARADTMTGPAAARTQANHERQVSTETPDDGRTGRHS
jgi:tRNA-dihydrouridine synthase A